MLMNSKDDVLRRLAEADGYILFEKGASQGAQDNDVISLKESGGANIEFDDGYNRKCPWRISLAIFDELQRESLVCQDGPEGTGHSLVFKLTRKGIERANLVKVQRIDAEGNVVGS